MSEHRLNRITVSECMVAFCLTVLAGCGDSAAPGAGAAAASIAPTTTAPTSSAPAVPATSVSAPVSGNSTNSTQVSATPAAPSATAPATPAALAASATSGQASLSWSASSGASSYNIKRSTTNGGPYTPLATSTSASYTDTAVTNGTTYYYVVVAVNATGSSANSAQASATPVAAVSVSQKAIVLTPTVTMVSYGGTVQLMAAISNSAGATVVWSIQETGNAGTITSDGRYTASSADGTYHIVATSSVDPQLQATATVTVSAPQGTPPVLTPGVWKEITPPAQGLKDSASFGANYVEVSPVDPNVIYVAVDVLGLWKSTDRGSNWRRLGVPNNYNGGTTTTYLDSPIRVEVDPGDPKHLVATQGVRGSTMGFWVSRDGGETWVMPKGFADIRAQTTNDVTTLTIDPTDFKHILLGSHSEWSNKPAGVMETKDGGDTWILHDGMSSWPKGTPLISFLYDPASGQGNSSTWLFGTEADGFWRTTNAGASWTKVTSYYITHGGGYTYYSKDGTLYSGAGQYPIRSRDNGITWEQMSDGLPYWYYYCIIGDGDTLYTQLAYTGFNAGQGLQPYMTVSEKTGGKWTAYKGGAQKFDNGPYNMNYEAANGIIYSANWRGGVWALKVVK